MRAPRVRRLTGAVTATLLLAGCGGEPAPDAESSATREPSTTSTPSAPPSGQPTGQPTGTPSDTPTGRAAQRYADAVSEPVEDSVYPEFGDDGVDALHYDLDLGWDPDARELTGEERLTFRAARTADSFVLDLGAGLEVEAATLGGTSVDTTRRGDQLTVAAPVTQDRTYVLALSYAGLSDPADAPSQRGDTPALGFEVSPDGQVRTMQEPFGAHTWYAVNDQPADKARYDVRLAVPAPWVGVSNGRLTARTRAGGDTVTEFTLDEPAAAYLMTLAFGPYEMTRDSAGGVPMTYWTPTDAPRFVDRLRKAPRGLRWLERRLGPYPFSSLGFVVVPGDSGMETQTMITLGEATDYNTSTPTLVHEMAHQWYGDQVGPCDWRDVWMNEGMATYLQILWEAHLGGRPEDAVMRAWARGNNALRRQYGPPGDYDRTAFASSNVYVPPASMWHALRERLGERTFWRLVRRWPRSQDNTCSDREELVSWWSEQSGQDLARFFQRWLMGRTDPR